MSLYCSSSFRICSLTELFDDRPTSNTGLKCGNYFESANERIIELLFSIFSTLTITYTNSIAFPLLHDSIGLLNIEIFKI